MSGRTAAPWYCCPAALNTAKHVLAGLSRPHDILYEVTLRADIPTVRGDGLSRAYMIDNQAIIILETIDAIRAFTGSDRNRESSITETNAALGAGLPLS